MATALNESTTALVALVVALIALVIATGQLADAILGRANGYRRCQESVMGDWAIFTHLKWRWSLLGFETRYVTPHIFISVIDEDVVTRNDDPSTPTCFLASNKPEEQPYKSETRTLGDLWTNLRLQRRLIWTWNATQYLIPSWSYFKNRIATSLHRRMIRKDIEQDPAKWPQPGLRDKICFRLERMKFVARSGEARNLSWCDFLETLVTDQDSSYPVDSDGSGPNIDGITRSRCAVFVELMNRCWEFQPPDITTPIASISARDLIILGHRLGMKWRQVDIAGGNLLAEGSVGILSSRNVRGIGSVVEFSQGARDFSTITRLRRLKSWTSDVVDGLGTSPNGAIDELGVGVVQGSELLLPLWHIPPRLEMCGRVDVDKATMNPSELVASLMELGLHSMLASQIGESVSDLKSLSQASDHLSAKVLLWDLLPCYMDYLPVPMNGRCTILHPLRFDTFVSPLAYIESQNVFVKRIGDICQDTKQVSEALVHLRDFMTEMTVEHKANGIPPTSYEEKDIRTLQDYHTTTTSLLHNILGLGKGSNQTSVTITSKLAPISLLQRNRQVALAPETQAEQMERLIGEATRTKDLYQALICAHLTMAYDAAEALNAKEVHLFRNAAGSIAQPTLQSTTGKTASPGPGQAHTPGTPQSPLSRSSSLRKRPTRTLSAAPSLRMGSANHAQDPDSMLRMTELAHLYVDHLPDVCKDRRLRRLMSECYPTYSDTEIDEAIRLAWWILILRCMAWYMSVKLHHESASFSVVPSSVGSYFKTIYMV
ncbi:Hypothetical protein D9617_22g066880 [Elsinoe fawcettii]|nr:Hypothetical protein D9617_22g066880 [Elsinoe fawcettii]